MLGKSLRVLKHTSSDEDSLEGMGIWHDLLYSIKSVYLRCSPGRSSPRYQMLVMNPGFFMPCILDAKIVECFDLPQSFHEKFQVFNNPLNMSVHNRLLTSFALQELEV